MKLRILVPLFLIALFYSSIHARAQASLIIDLAESSPERNRMTRIYGSRGQGNLGVPLAPPADVDGDGIPDFGVAYLRASPLGRSGAGEINVVFGTGRLGESFDTFVDQPRLLRVFGDVNQEAAGNEIWMDDVTGDGIADLLVGRQNFSIDEKIGAGALTIITGGPALRALAAGSRPLDLRNPDPAVSVFTLVGRRGQDRLGIWLRTGDVDGDGVADVVVGADQEDREADCQQNQTCFNQGAAYVLRGGSHLSNSVTLHLGSIAGSSLAGHLARLLPPDNGARFHTGATCFIGDLDGNGRGEVLAAAALNRAGAIIDPAGAPGTAEGSGGAPRGELYIAWDDQFPSGLWPHPYDLDLSGLGGSGTRIRGGPVNGIFGEEIIAGGDFDGDGGADLFVGDFEADESPSRNRPLSGTGYVFYAASGLKGLDFAMDALPPGIALTRILGPSSFAIGADTAATGDFNHDGFSDLLFGSPHHDPLGRDSAGSIHVLMGQAGGWPPVVSTASEELPAISELMLVEIDGAHGAQPGDRGDTLCYSAAAGDADGDGVDDLLTNEMVGNGLSPGTVDVGNLVILAGQEVSRANRLLFAQMASGRGLVSQLILTNPSPEIAVSGTVEVRGPEGATLPILGTGTGALPAGPGVQRVAFDVNPLGSFTVETTDSGVLAAGGAVVSSNGRLGGFIRFMIPDLGITGVPPSDPVSSFIVPIRTDPTKTGLAVFNPSDSNRLLRISLVQSDGIPALDEMVMELGPNGHISLFVTELFPQLISLGSFTGSLVARVEGGDVAAVALDVGATAGQLLAVPVIEMSVP